MRSKTAKLPAITEKQFDRQVVQLAKLCGWLCYHTWRSVNSEAGFPDRVFVRGGRLIFAELKSDTGKETADQTTWLTALRATSAEVYLWRPRDFDDIQRILA